MALQHLAAQLLRIHDSVSELMSLETNFLNDKTSKWLLSRGRQGSEGNSGVLRGLSIAGKRENSNF